MYRKVGNKYIKANNKYLDVLTPILWFDASDSNTIEFSTGNQIETWKDKSGNENDATQITLSQQAILTGDSIYIDGSNIVFYDLAKSIELSRFTIFAVRENLPNALASEARYLFFGYKKGSPSDVGGIGTNLKVDVNNIPDSGMFISRFGTLVNVPKKDVNVTNLKQVMVWNNDYLEDSNGVLNLSNPINFDIVLDTLFRGDSSSLTGKGYTYELMIFDRDLSIVEKNRIKSRLSSKWNI